MTDSRNQRRGVGLRVRHTVGTLSSVGSIVVVLGGLTVFSGLFVAVGFAALTSHGLQGWIRVCAIVGGLGGGLVTAGVGMWVAVTGITGSRDVVRRPVTTRH